MFRYVHEAIELLAELAPTLEQAVEIARGKAFVILDGSLLRIDRVGMASDYNCGFYSGIHKCHGVNVQVVADPAARLVWISPTLPGARHDIAAAREHGIIDALAEAGVRAVADTAYQGAGEHVIVPQRRRRLDPRHRPLPTSVRGAEGGQHRDARQRGPGERVNAELKNWRLLRKIRSSPSEATKLVQAV